MEIKIQDTSYLHGNVDMYLKVIIASALDVIPIKHHGKERANDKNKPDFISTNQGWGLLSQFPPFWNCHHCQNTLYMLNIAYIFDRCRRSWAAGTPVKYECDSRNLTCTFARSTILLTQKLTNGVLVTPTPVFYYTSNSKINIHNLQLIWDADCLTIFNHSMEYESHALLDFKSSKLRNHIQRKHRHEW